MRLIDLSIKYIKKFCSVLMILMLLVTFAQVVNRYIFGQSFFWSEELAILCMVWVCFLGSVIAIREDSHTRIDFLINLLPSKVKKAVQVIDYWLMTAFVLYLGYLSLDVLKINKDVLTLGLQIPKAVMYGGLTIGMVLLAIYMIILSVCIIINYDVNGGEN